MTQAVPSARTGAAPALLQRLIDAGAQRAQGRRNAEQHTRQAGYEQGKCKYAAIHLDRIDGAHRQVKVVQLENVKQDAGARRRQQQPSRAARERQHDALGEQLARETGAGCPERAPDCEFLLPRRAARQQQVRDVDAGNQQNECDGRQQRQHGGAQALHPEIAQA